MTNDHCKNHHMYHGKYPYSHRRQSDSNLCMCSSSEPYAQQSDH